MSTNLIAGYGPSGSSRSRPYFTGQADNFEIWEARFVNYVYTLDRGVYRILLPNTEGIASNEDDQDKNRRTYTELVQVLDKRSLIVQLLSTETDLNTQFPPGLVGQCACLLPKVWGEIAKNANKKLNKICQKLPNFFK